MGFGIDFASSEYHIKLQQVEQTAHQLDQHHIMRCFGNGKMKTGIRASCLIVITQQLIMCNLVITLSDFFYIIGCGALCGIPGCTAFQNQTRLLNIKTVFRINIH
ncbi:Uncharacterised protein [Mycobacteroides abscessus]|nr:Uncharacterised protein [Mycobacteroides abscessus]